MHEIIILSALIWFDLLSSRTLFTKLKVIKHCNLNDRRNSNILQDLYQVKKIFVHYFVQ